MGSQGIAHVGSGFGSQVVLASGVAHNRLREKVQPGKPFASGRDQGFE